MAAGKSKRVVRQYPVEFIPATQLAGASTRRIGIDAGRTCGEKGLTSRAGYVILPPFGGERRSKRTAASLRWRGA